MKTKIFLAMGLMASIYGYGQTYSAPTTSPAAGSNGSNNVHLGHSAGAVSVGNDNVFIGQEAGLNNTDGYKNVFVGEDAGKSNSVGSENVFIGQAAGLNNTLGEDNTFIGYGSGAGNTEGIDNVSLGTNAGRFNLTGNGNTYLGRASGYYNNSTIGYNVFVGYWSGLNNTGNYNVFIGNRAGLNNVGGFNVFIGNRAGENELGNQRLYIANTATVNPLIYGEFDNKVICLNTSKVGIGSTFDPATEFATSFDSSNYRVFIKGGILAEEVRIRRQDDWPDYVFAPIYKLLPLKEVEQYIAENGHLPNMPSAAEVKEQGIEMGNIVNLQQEKIEELTLHLIRQEKEIEALKEQNKQLEELQQQVEILLKKQ